MAAQDSQGTIAEDAVIKAIRQAIAEIDKRPKDEKDDKGEKEEKDDPVRQLADELDDILRRYIVETAVPARAKA